MEYVNVSQRPSLRNPILITAFAGWNDAATVATSAVRFLVEQWSASKFATIDPEEFFVFSETRPRVRLVAGTFRQIDWPANEFFYYVDPKGARDYILLLGIEPQLKWRTFARVIFDLAAEYGVSKVVTLGGLLADVAHTLPARITGSSSDPLMQERLSGITAVSSSRYEGPTGIVGVLSSLYQEHGMPTASIWGNVPHYLTENANPKVTREILRALGAALGMKLDLKQYDAAILEFEAQIAEALAKNPEIATYVQHLEQRDRQYHHAMDEEQSPAADQNPPTAESLLKELEDFLRRRREDTEPDKP